MKAVLNESQIEYQKLYDICVTECEKAQNLNDLYLSEKSERELKEQVLLQMSEEVKTMKRLMKECQDAHDKQLAEQLNEVSIRGDVIHK